MKKQHLISVMILFLVLNVIKAQHFQPVWTGNPYQVMNFIVTDASIDGIVVESGDEIAVYDTDGSGGEICVGSIVLAAPPDMLNPAIFMASADDPTTQNKDGFSAGNEIKFRLWDSSESLEITGFSATFDTTATFVSVYTELATSIAEVDFFSSVSATAASVQTCQGSLPVPIATANFMEVSEFNLVLAYNTSHLTYNTFQNVNSLLSPGTLSVTDLSGSVEINWTSGTAVTILSGDLLELVFNAPAPATTVLSDLLWDAASSYFIDINGDTMPENLINGVITILPVPDNAVAVYGSGNVCQGDEQEPYYTDSIAGATTYAWEVNPANAGTVNGSGTNIIINWSAAYSGLASLSVYGSNICGNGQSSTLSVNVNPNPTVYAGPDDMLCENQTYTMQGSATDYAALQWTTSGDGWFNDPSLIAPVYMPGPNDILTGSVDLTLTAIAISPCYEMVSDVMSLGFSLLPFSDAGNDGSICEGNTFQLAGYTENDDGFVWSTSGDGDFNNTGILNPVYTPGINDIASGGVYLTLAAFAEPPCTDDAVDEIYLTITGLPGANAGPDDLACEDDPVYTLQGTASNFDVVYWVTSGDGTFDDASSLNATYTAGNNDLLNEEVQLTLYATAIPPCEQEAVDDMILGFVPSPSVEIDITNPVCENQSSYVYGYPSSYSSVLWSTTGDGTFDDPQALSTFYSPGINDILNGTTVLKLSVYPIAPCTDVASDEMNLTIQQLPDIYAGPDDSICMQTEGYALNASAVNATGYYWSTSGDGFFSDTISLNAVYYPGSSDYINGYVVLTLTADPFAPCVDEQSDNMTLHILPYPLAFAGEDDTICMNTPSYTLSEASAQYQTSLEWTTSGDGNFNDPYIQNPLYIPGSADISNGEVYLIMTVISVPCDTITIDSLLLTFAVLPVADAGPDDLICETDAVYLSGSANFYSSVLWTTSGDGNFDDPGLLNPLYSPGNLDIINGGATLTLTAYPNYPCTDEIADNMLLEIQPLPVADAPPNDTICMNTPSYNIYGSTVGNQNSILWTTSGDGSFSDPLILNPTYYPGMGDIAAGSVVLSLTAYALNPCQVDASDDMHLVFALLPSANAGSDDSICETSSYTLSGSAENCAFVLWTTSGDGYFDDPAMLNANYTPGPADINSGNVNLSLTAGAVYPCSEDSIDHMNLSIFSLPLADAGQDTEICETTGSVLIDDASASGYQSLLWTTSGDGYFDDPYALVTTYFPGQADFDSTYVELRLTCYPNPPCTDSVSDVKMLFIQAQPFSYAGEDNTGCESEGYMLNGYAENYSNVWWSSTGDGAFDDPTSLTAIYTPGPLDGQTGSVVLTLWAYAIAPCSGESGDEMLLIVNPIPTVFAGIDDTICVGSSSLLAGTASNYESVLWTTTGDGFFDDPNMLNATYTPDSLDIENGFVDLILTAFQLSPCNGSSNDTMRLFIKDGPETPEVPFGPDVVDISVTAACEYNISSVHGADEYMWILEPETAGNITFQDTNCVVNWNYPPACDTSFLMVIAMNECDTTSKTLPICIYTSVGIKEIQADVNIKIIPNPARSNFRVEIKGIDEKIEIDLISSNGRYIKGWTLNGKMAGEFDVGTEPAGIYYLRIYNRSFVKVKRLVLQP